MGLFTSHCVYSHCNMNGITWHHMFFNIFFFSNFFACCDMPIHIMMYDKFFKKISFINFFFFNWTFFQYFFKSSHSSMHWNLRILFAISKKKNNGYALEHALIGGKYYWTKWHFPQPFLGEMGCAKPIPLYKQYLF